MAEEREQISRSATDITRPQASIFEPLTLNFSWTRSASVTSRRSPHAGQVPPVGPSGANPLGVVVERPPRRRGWATVHDQRAGGDGDVDTLGLDLQQHVEEAAALDGAAARRAADLLAERPLGSLSRRCASDSRTAARRPSRRLAGPRGSPRGPRTVPSARAALAMSTMTAASCRNNTRVEGKCGSTSASKGLASVAIVQRTSPGRLRPATRVDEALGDRVDVPSALCRHQVSPERLLNERVSDGGDVPERAGALEAAGLGRVGHRLRPPSSSVGGRRAPRRPSHRRTAVPARARRTASSGS